MINSERKWSPSEEQYLAAHYPTGDNIQIAAHLGRGHKAIVAHANKLGLHKTKAISQMDLNILAIKDRPNGFICADLPGDSHDNSGAITRMVKAGRLFCVKEHRYPVRYFASLPVADAWRTRTDRAPDVTIRHDRSRAWWNTRAQPGDSDYLEPQITDRTVISFGPSPRLGLRTSTYLE